MESEEQCGVSQSTVERDGAPQRPTEQPGARRATWSPWSLPERPGASRSTWERPERPERPRAVQNVKPGLLDSSLCGPLLRETLCICLYRLPGQRQSVDALDKNPR